MINDSRKVAEVFNDYFKDSTKTLIKNDFGSGDLVLSMNCNAPILNFKELTKTKVHTIISSLNSSRAKDVYGMDTIFLKTYKEAFILPILKLLIGL